MQVRLLGGAVTVLVPRAKDPRLVQIAALVAAMVIRVAIVHHSLTGPQVPAALLTAIAVDVALTYVRRRVLITPLSALVTGCIVILMLQSGQVWPFALAAGLAIVSKHLIRAENQHVFTPSACGLAIVLLGFPTIVHVATEDWKVSAALAPFITVGGVMASSRAKTQTMGFVFLPTYIVVLIVVLLASHGALLFHAPKAAFHSLTGTVSAIRESVQIFAFYMVTDPRTAPPTPSGRRLAAILIAVFGVLLAIPGADRVVSLLVALLVTNAATALWITRRYAHEDPVTDATRVRPPPVVVWGAVVRLSRAVRTRRSEVEPAPVEAVAQPPRENRQLSAASAIGPSGAMAETLLFEPRAATVDFSLCVTGDSPGRFPLNGGSATVGRADDNDICLEAQGVSRYHARFRREAGRMLLEDLGSTNGTFVNGRRLVESAELQHGDRIDFGSSRTGVSATFSQASRAT